MESGVIAEDAILFGTLNIVAGGVAMMKTLTATPQYLLAIAE